MSIRRRRKKTRRRNNVLKKSSTVVAVDRVVERSGVEVAGVVRILRGVSFATRANRSEERRIRIGYGRPVGKTRSPPATHTLTAFCAVLLSVAGVFSVF